ncbi:MAG: RpiB/LacA/LacB family sugar-phosphate isomerase [Patescibacteria group bacterium]
MKVYLASDHAGFDLKNILADFLREEGHEVEDLGPHTMNTSDDYPDYMRPLAEKVAQNKGTFGIVLGMSGQGEAMVANRIKGARAAVYYGKDSEIVTLSRQHNDANVLSLGARFISIDEAKDAVHEWLSTPFSEDERHIRRIQKIDA